MKKISTERLLRLYIVASGILLIALLGLATYLTIAVHALQVSNAQTEDDITHICKEVDTSQYPDYYECGGALFGR